MYTCSIKVGFYFYRNINVFFSRGYTFKFSLETKHFFLIPNHSAVTMFCYYFVFLLSLYSTGYGQQVFYDFDLFFCYVFLYFFYVFKKFLGTKKTYSVKVEKHLLFRGNPELFSKFSILLLLNGFSLAFHFFASFATFLF